MALTAAVIASLSGCADFFGSSTGEAKHVETTGPLTKENMMTPDEAVAKQLVPLADAVGQHVGAGWEPDGTLTPGAVGQAGDDCVLPDGTRGVSFTVEWLGPPVADVDEAAQAVQAAWKALGTDSEIVNDSHGPDDEGRILSDPPYLTGTYADDYIVQLVISMKGTVMVATTHCVIDPDQRKVPNGEVFATQASHDGWAPTGQVSALEQRTDPTDPSFGTHAFSSDGTDGSLPVTRHGPVGGPDPGNASYWDAKTESIVDAAKATLGKGASIPVGGTPGERLLKVPDIYIEHLTHKADPQ